MFEATFQISPHDAEHCGECRWAPHGGGQCRLFIPWPRGDYIEKEFKDSMCYLREPFEEYIKGPHGVEVPWIRCPACFAAEREWQKQNNKT
jgi:hypothetical protein